MKFINQSEDSLENILTDGQQTCTYRNIPKLFEQIRAFFNKEDISRQYPLILECDNSLAGSLTLLYLLEEGYSFLLTPRETKESLSHDPSGNFPSFCRYKIKTAVVNQDHLGLFRPDEALQITVDDKSGNINKADLEDPKMYLRTSGSTGKPKLVVHSHARLKNNALNCARRLEITSDFRIAIPVPIAHMYGLGAAFLPAVLTGASTDLQQGANLLRYLQREREFNPDTAFMTPVFCETLLAGRRASRLYRLTVTAGDRFRGQDTFAKYESLFGPVVNLYGSTEMGAMAAGSPDDPREMRTQTSGRPMPGVQMRLEERDAESESGEEMKGAGELWCSHPAGFKKYIDEKGRSTDDTPSSYQKKWFRTKDLGRIKPDGRIEVIGRSDHCVNRDGLLVSFAEVEYALRAIKKIEDAVVVSEGENRRGKKLVACCLLRKGAAINPSEVRAACFNLLPTRAVPDDILFLEALPLLASGKIDRQKLITMVKERII